MSYLRRLDRIVAQDDFNPVAILKYDSRFTTTVNNVIQTVKHFDNQYPDVGMAEILAAMMNEVMESIFPQLNQAKDNIVDDIIDLDD